MKKFLTTTAVIGALTSPALAADSLPGIYVSHWCGDIASNQEKSPTFGMCSGDPDPEADDILVVNLKPTGFNYFGDGENYCRFKSIVKTKTSWPRMTKPRPGDWPKGDYVPEVFVRADCGKKFGVVRFLFSWAKGDELIVTSVDGVCLSPDGLPGFAGEKECK
jgi:hypothetical protein